MTPPDQLWIQRTNYTMEKKKKLHNSSKKQRERSMRIVCIWLGATFQHLTFLVVPKCGEEEPEGGNRGPLTHTDPKKPGQSYK